MTRLLTPNRSERVVLALVIVNFDLSSTPKDTAVDFGEEESQKSLQGSCLGSTIPAEVSLTTYSLHKAGTEANFQRAGQSEPRELSAAMQSPAPLLPISGFEPASRPRIEPSRRLSPCPARTTCPWVALWFLLTHRASRFASAPSPFNPSEGVSNRSREPASMRAIN
jgi:hypothetical protein